MLKRTFLLLVLLLLILYLSSCQTVQGAGKDITWMGEKTSDALNGLN